MKTFSLALLFTILFSFNTNAVNNVAAADSPSIIIGDPIECVSWSRTITLELADVNGEDPNGENFDYYIEFYNSLYEHCLSR